MLHAALKLELEGGPCGCVFGRKAGRTDFRFSSLLSVRSVTISIEEGSKDRGLPWVEANKIGQHKSVSQKDEHLYLERALSFPFLNSANGWDGYEM